MVPKPITGRDDSAVATARENLRTELAFLYSTPAYRGTLDRLGRPDIADRLAQSAQAGNWTALPTLLTDDILKTLVPQATYKDLPTVLHSWYPNTCHGISLDLPPTPADDPAFRTTLRTLASA
ncbi:MAG: F420-dependent oxidoreductase [Nocardia sp.]|uniref:hypothetical protein n=1 Tax=Nocardia sp. TaxID=1821 RepID=UPI00262E5ADA|nr:hypothetical protein [Nocardia sp.]MCU1641510.1 F420-dependent oxidoreductase [Nocardia sp.]